MAGIRPKVPEFDDFYELIDEIVAIHQRRISKKQWADMFGMAEKTFKARFLTAGSDLYFGLDCLIRMIHETKDPSIAELFARKAGFRLAPIETDKDDSGIRVNGAGPLHHKP